MYKVTARNFSDSHENRMHSDDVAKRYGFSGALVPGVAVYGHLSYPLVEHYGVKWLESGHDSLRLLKPAYHEDELTLQLQNTHGLVQSSALNTEGVLLATATELAPEQSLNPYDSPHAIQEAPIKAAGRPEISWENVVPGERLKPWVLDTSSQANTQFTQQISDNNPLYKTYIHPHLIAGAANSVLTAEYTMPAWIHVGTQTLRHKAIHVDDEISVDSIVTKTWQRKGHSFLEVYIQLQRDNLLTTEMLHTAIFEVAEQ